MLFGIWIITLSLKNNNVGGKIKKTLFIDLIKSYCNSFIYFEVFTHGTLTLFLWILRVFVYIFLKFGKNVNAYLNSTMF